MLEEPTFIFWEKKHVCGFVLFFHYINNAEAMDESCAKATFSLLLELNDLELSKNELGDSVSNLCLIRKAMVSFSRHYNLDS